MNQLIREITERLFSNLPETDTGYEVQKLEEYGLPSFVVRRIDIELAWNLEESLTLPETDWANMESDSVHEAWQYFLNRTHSEVYLPAGYARAVIETAVSDIVEILVQPRKNIAELLFGGEEVLSAEQLTERTELLVVYPHFARILTRYVERKEQNKLERSRCKEIIATTDARLTDSYTPFQWAQMLDPLFKLTETPIDPDIFRLFFEDKDKPEAAQKFEQFDEKVSRSTFIEILTSPEFFDEENTDQDEPELLSSDDEEGDQETGSDGLVENEVESVTEQSDVSDEEFMEELSDLSADTHGPEANQTEKEKISSDAEDMDDSKSDRQVEEQVLSSEPYQNGEENKDTASLNDIYINEEREEGELNEQAEPEEVVNTTEQESNSEIVENEKKSVISPIWQRFMSAEEEAEGTENEEKAGDEFDTDSYKKNTPEKEELENRLVDEKEYFVEELFNGSLQAYEKSLREISSEDNWKDASKRIEEDIFKRNQVDIYSDPALDFIDRLHTYFLEKENHN